ncbi:MAG: hypothetical protein AAFY82_07975 [Pseudomonadota bacterium]
MIYKSPFGKVIALSLLATGLVSACETSPMASDTNLVGAGALTEADAATGEGIYYPKVTLSDQPEIRFGPILGAGPQERQFFVDQINRAATTSERDIALVVQAVGTENQTLLFMPLNRDGSPTPYIAKAMLARMTSVLRFAPAITEMGISQEMDVYNMAAILGFDRIVVTDGRAFSYQADVVLSADN